MENSFRPVVSFALKDAKFQVLAAVIAHSLVIHAGINMAFSTIVLPQIMNSTMSRRNETITDAMRVDKDQATWIASLVTITTPIGSLLSGVLMDQYGRKTVCFLTAASLIIAWVATATVSSQVYVLYIARTLAGFGSGLSTAALVYVSEISHASIRPMLLSLNSGFVSFGILLATFFGYLLPWRSVAWINAALAVASFVIMFLMPESPVYLWNINAKNSQKRNRRVRKSVRWLYRKSDACEAEIQNLTQPKVRNTETDSIITEAQNNARKSNHWKPIWLLMGLFFLQQFSGGYIVIFYAIPIFQEIGSLQLDEWTSLILLGVIRFLMAILSTFLSRKTGRRVLLMTSAAGMAISTLAAFLLSIMTTADVVTTSCILIFVCFSSYGFLVIPWTLIGELLPHKIRGKGSGLMISFAYLLMFATVKMFIYVLDAIGMSYILLFLSVTSMVSVIYVYFFIPETLGKTFEEIEQLMNTNLIILHVVCASMAFVHLAAALCGRRGSPAFRAAENIIHNSTSRDWSVLRCFLARIIRYESQREEPAPFFECILNAIGIEITATPIPATVDEMVLEIKATSPTLAGLAELRLCLNHRMSCPEVRHILVCRQAIDDVYITRPIVTQNRSAIT